MTQPLPPLSDSEREELKASISRDGVRYPVLVDPSGVVIDGHHREEICTQLGIEYPTVTLDVDEETADRLRVVLNTARRQLSVKDRRMLTIELRAKGRSTRQIAEQVGVSHETVRKDLATGNPLTVDPLPTTVVGRDGKQRKATTPSRGRAAGRRRAEPKSADQRTPAQSSDVAARPEDKAAPEGTEGVSVLPEEPGCDAFWRRVMAAMAIVTKTVDEATGEIARTGLPRSRSSSGEVKKKARTLARAVESFEKAAVAAGNGTKVAT